MNEWTPIPLLVTEYVDKSWKRSFDLRKLQRVEEGTPCSQHDKRLVAVGVDGES